MGFFTSWFKQDNLKGEVNALRLHNTTLEIMCKDYENLLTDQGQHCANYAEAYFVLRNFVGSLKGKKAILALSDSQRAFVGVDEHKYIIHRADVLKNIIKETTPVPVKLVQGTELKQDDCTRIDCYADYPHGSH